MTSDQSDSSESKTIEALVPMVDLFAVLAIMFMIYSNEEITYAKQESAAEIQKVVEQVEGIAEEEQARKDRREFLAQKTGKSLEQLKAEQAQKAQELIEQFTNMVAVQQSQAAIEYEELVSSIEFEHEEALDKEVASLNEESRADLAKKKGELETDLANRKLELEEEKKEELVLARLQHEKDAVSKAMELTAEKQEALAKSRQENAQLLQEQKSTFERQQEDELRALKREHQEAIASVARALDDTREALADSDQQRQEVSTRQELELARQKKELARVERALKAQAASQAARLEAEKERALAAAKQERLKLEAERERALAKADEAEKLASETELYLARLAGELDPYLKADEAKQKIVERLKENFKDFDSEAVEIDEKTGKVRLHFQETYFARGSYVLSEDMKSFLRIMIPKYAKSIYENKGAAKHIESLKISGMTSPVHFGKYVDINDRSPGTERARRYNMKLSNKRALAMYNFIFDEAEMSNYRYRDRLKADMGIAALGFQNAKPVMDELVGQPADCIKYDCKHEQATVLQFHLLSED